MSFGPVKSGGLGYERSFLTDLWAAPPPCPPVHARRVFLAMAGPSESALGSFDIFAVGKELQRIVRMTDCEFSIFRDGRPYLSP
jgi:hypothetical protein